MTITSDFLNYDVVIVGQQPWDTEIGSNCKNIAIELSKSTRVIYVNSPLDRITLYRSKNDPNVIKRKNVIAGNESGLIKINENLWTYYPDCMVESINWIQIDFLFDIANKINNYRFAKSIKKALESLSIKHFVLFNDNEMFKGYYLKDYLKPFLSLYYSRDFMLAVDYWKKHGEKYEPKLIRKSDICVANSTYLAEYCKGYNRESYYVGQGCDFTLFNHRQTKIIPADLAVVKTPIIGYVGALQSIRLDKEIIKFIALNKPEWSIVLVGPEDEEFLNSDLHQIPNIIFIGMRPLELLSNYINAFDVCINPQLINQVTIGNYPRKIDEYLAMGKPVVATSTKAMESFSKYVYLADSKEEYVKLIDMALSDTSSEANNARISFAHGHTWENSVGAIRNAIVEYQKQA
jgi:teichuronic acid biosynthesis glycosyltransferase TuaH